MSEPIKQEASLLSKVMELRERYHSSRIRTDAEIQNEVTHEILKIAKEFKIDENFIFCEESDFQFLSKRLKQTI